MRDLLFYAFAPGILCAIGTPFLMAYEAIKNRKKKVKA